MEVEYLASGFRGGAGSRTTVGKLTVHALSVRFQHDQGIVELPLSGLRIRAGGHDGAQLFFEHPEHPDWSLYTTDRAVLRQDALTRDPVLAEQIRQITKPRGMGKPLLVFAVFGLVLALPILVLLATKDRIVRYLAFQVPAAWESELANSVLDQVLAQSKLTTDPALAAKLETAASRLKEISADAGYPLRFHLVDDPAVNAFALPGGNVVVLSGLLNTAERPEEIAGVLAHEIAHVTERHVFRKIIDTAGLSLIVRSLLGDGSGMLGLIGNSSELLLQQKYSRNFEREADDVGWEYLVAAKIDPRGLTDFFRTLLQEEGIQGPGLLSTHPTTSERIERLESKWEQMNPKPETHDLEPPN